MYTHPVFDGFARMSLNPPTKIHGGSRAYRTKFV